MYIPSADLQRLSALSKDKEWIVYRGVGRRAYVMERMLRRHGYRPANLSGGWTTYKVRRSNKATSEGSYPAYLQK